MLQIIPIALNRYRCVCLLDELAIPIPHCTFVYSQRNKSIDFFHPWGTYKPIIMTHRISFCDPLDVT